MKECVNELLCTMTRIQFLHMNLPVIVLVKISWGYIYVLVNLLLMIYVLTFVCVFFWNCETSKKIHHIHRHYPFKLNSDVYLYINDKFMKKEKEIYMFLNILYQGACENNLRNNRLVDDLILQFKSVRYMCQHLILITSIEISHSFSCVFFLNC